MVYSVTQLRTCQTKKNRNQNQTRLHMFRSGWGRRNRSPVPKKKVPQVSLTFPSLLPWLRTLWVMTYSCDNCSKSQGGFFGTKEYCIWLAMSASSRHELCICMRAGVMRSVFQSTICGLVEQIEERRKKKPKVEIISSYPERRDALVFLALMTCTTRVGWVSLDGLSSSFLYSLVYRSLGHAGNRSRCPSFLSRHGQPLLQIALLSRPAGILARRGRVETDSRAAVLAVLADVVGGAACEAARSTTDGAADIPLTLLREPPESR